MKFSKMVAAGAGVIALVGSLVGTAGVASAAPAKCELQPATSEDARPLYNCPSFEISPARTVLAPADLAKPQTYRVINTGNTKVHLDVTAQQFTQQRNGSIALDAKASALPESPAKWLTITPKSFDIEAGKSTNVKFTIKVPDNAPNGEQMVAVTFTRPSANSGNIKVSGSIGAQVLILVPGPVVRDVQLTELTPTYPKLFNKIKLPFFTDSVALNLTAVNKGTVHRDFYAPDANLSVTVTGFGVGKATYNMGDFSVLRGATRDMHADWSDALAKDEKATKTPPLFCLCKATITTDNGSDTPTTVTRSFVIFPIVQVVAGLIILIGLIMVYRGLRKSSKKRKEKTLAAMREAAKAEALAALTQRTGDESETATPAKEDPIA